MADKHSPYTLSDWLNYLSHPEIDYLIKLSSTLADSPVVVNIGAGGGTSGLTFRSSRPDLFLVTIDPAREANPYGSLESEAGILEAAGLLDYGHYKAIQGDSKQVGKEWSSYVDMVFIDGDHTYEGCRGDIEAWWPWIKRGGVVAIHDYRKVDNFLRHYPDFAVTQEVIGQVIKPYPGVDSSTEDTLFTYPDAEFLGVVDSLVAFRKKV